MAPIHTAIRLDLTVEECNLILEALGQAPYVRVAALVGKVQQQASAQLAERARP